MQKHLLSGRKWLLVLLLLTLSAGLQAQPPAEFAHADYQHLFRAMVGLSDTCSCAVTLSGTNNEIVGGMHSNTCIYANTPNDSQYESSAVDVAGSNLVPPPVSSSVHPDPIYYQLSEFDDPTDLFVITAEAYGELTGQSAYRKYAGNITLPNATSTALQMRDGLLIYVDGDVTINGSGLSAYNTYRLTIVATGEIRLSTTATQKVFRSFLNMLMGDPHYSLLFYSGKDARGTGDACNVNVQSSRGIYISMNQSDFWGMLYAPNSNITLAGSESEFSGNLMGWRVNSLLNSSYIELNPNSIPYLPYVTPTPTHTPSDTPTDLPSDTPSDTPTDTPTVTPSDTATYTPSDTATFTPSNTATDTATATPSDTATSRPSDTATFTATATASHTLTHTPTGTPSETPSHTPTFTFTNTPSNSPTSTVTECVLSAVAPNLIQPEHRTHTTDTTPSFAWTLVNNAQSYRLMLYTEDHAFEYKKRVFTPSYTLTTGEALAPAKYLWRVRTQDNTCGTWSEWSNRFTLFID